MINGYNIQPILVLNNDDRKYYDIAPLFYYLKDNGRTFEELSDDIERATELLPDLYETENYNNRELSSICYYLNNFKRCLRKVKPIDI